ncbi:PAS domain-containing sensor histidine kinase [Thalassobius sp. Cn5-15]|uniref:sensor histidine kinase NtrY-like n=1 Tax=Thalassobius sp. Cn5-15 TaxID=2917763 RepID=UPI001EF1DDCC|nr:PAS domain-containing sensor histidine kinase [Thalassobius sp. Cn5-15]MCG7492185.1 PAS domain-containing sensor histidine kinase [Thalassobius sp. Cn5-15]
MAHQFEDAGVAFQAQQKRAHSRSWAKISRLRRQRKVQNIATFCLVVLAPILVVATYLVLGPLDQGGSSFSLRLILLADFVYALLVAALVLQRIAALISARRAKSAGSKLHLRLTGAFAFLALIPTVSVAIFAALTVNVGLEGWFSDRVRQVVGSSLAAAEAYEEEHRRDLTADTLALAAHIDRARRKSFFITDGDVRVVLTQGQSQVQRGLKEAYVVDGTGEIRARGDRSYLFDFEEPTSDQLQRASEDGVQIIADWPNNEFRALVRLNAFVDRFLYVSREVDGSLLGLLDDTKQTAQFYQQLESERGRVLFEFGLIYLGFAMILILAAIWLGLWFAERLSGPVGRLAGAAQRVGGGDLDVRVVEQEGDDEIAMLGRYFNQMTRQLKAQRQELLENTEQVERRRRLFDSVLSSVTSGVVGLDEEGRVTFVNRSAERLLDWKGEEHAAVALAVAVPEFAALFDRLTDEGMGAVQGEIKVTRNGRLENLLVRMATRQAEDGALEGYVVAFDDVSDLVAAQRMAAWGDVARRIAHEIKNPLTPIQLSAERIKRKFGRQLDQENADSLAQLTEVIVRQTNDLRRIVDEFSKFARMPEPDRRSEDLVKLVRDAVVLQQAGQPDVTFDVDLPDQVMNANLDATMISQALTNLIKNAGEAIESYNKNHRGDEVQGEIRVALIREGRSATLRISDNGIGLPEDRARLFEPYVTTRSEGTGLGLPIVKKILEEHGGTLSLEDAPAFEDTTRFGAMAVVRLLLTDPVEAKSAEVQVKDVRQ